LEVFLFICFTSPNIGDLKKLRIEHIGEKSFTYYRIKNRNSKPEPIVVPLSTPAKIMIRKLSGYRTTGLLFNYLPAEPTINEKIKIIAKSIGINKKLTTRSGRHTFATIFLKRTKDLATLKEIMGHTDYRETLIYAHVLEESKISGVSTFNDFEV
jgi:integrase